MKKHNTENDNWITYNMNGFHNFVQKKLKKDYILHKSIYAKLKKAETMALEVRIIILGISS